MCTFSCVRLFAAYRETTCLRYSQVAGVDFKDTRYPIDVANGYARPEFGALPQSG